MRRHALTVFLCLFFLAATIGFALPDNSLQDAPPDEAVSPDEAPLEIVAPPNDLPAAARSWGEALNPSGAIPERGFQAFYFNHRNPTGPATQERVESVALNVGDVFHQIAPENLGAYWVGRLSFDEAKTIKISVGMGRGAYRMFIDGRLVVGEKRMFRRFAYDFSPGDHLVEVEYVSKWQSASFKAIFEEESLVVSEAGVAEFLRRAAPVDAVVHYVGISASSAQDAGVEVVAPPFGRPVVFWLSSYRAVDWRIQSSDPVAAVVFASHEPASRVFGVGDAEVANLAEFRLGGIGERRRCYCIQTVGFRCDRDEALHETLEWVERTTNKPVAGYAADDNSVSRIVVKAYDAGAILALRSVYGREEEDRRSCDAAKSGGRMR